MRYLLLLLVLSGCQTQEANIGPIRRIERIEGEENAALCPLCKGPIMMAGQVDADTIQLICINNHLISLNSDGEMKIISLDGSSAAPIK